MASPFKNQSLTSASLMGHSFGYTEILCSGWIDIQGAKSLKMSVLSMMINFTCQPVWSRGAQIQFYF